MYGDRLGQVPNVARSVRQGRQIGRYGAAAGVVGAVGRAEGSPRGGLPCPASGARCGRPLGTSTGEPRGLGRRTQPGGKLTDVGRQLPPPGR